MKTKYSMTAEERRILNQRKKVTRIIRCRRFKSYAELYDFIFRGSTYGSNTRAYVICDRAYLEDYIERSVIRKEHELRTRSIISI